MSSNAAIGFQILQAANQAQGAFNQVGLIASASAFLTIGGLLLGYGRYLRHHALRIEGRIVDMAKKDAYYYPVYRYMMNGKEQQAQSNVGCGSPSSLEIGKTVPLLVFPNQPETAMRANGYLLEVLAGSFIVGAVVALVIASQAFGGFTKLTMFALATALCRWTFQLAWNMHACRRCTPSR